MQITETERFFIGSLTKALIAQSVDSGERKDSKFPKVLYPRGDSDSVLNITKPCTFPERKKRMTTADSKINERITPVVSRARAD